MTKTNVHGRPTYARLVTDSVIGNSALTHGGDGRTVMPGVVVAETTLGSCTRADAAPKDHAAIFMPGFRPEHAALWREWDNTTARKGEYSRSEPVSGQELSFDSRHQRGPKALSGGAFERHPEGIHMDAADRAPAGATIIPFPHLPRHPDVPHNLPPSAEHHFHALVDTMREAGCADPLKEAHGLFDAVLKHLTAEGL